MEVLTPTPRREKKKRKGKENSYPSYTHSKSMNIIKLARKKTEHSEAHILARKGFLYRIYI
jgi:hypothetical protein